MFDESGSSSSQASSPQIIALQVLNQSLDKNTEMPLRKSKTLENSLKKVKMNDDNQDDLFPEGGCKELS